MFSCTFQLFNCSIRRCNFFRTNHLYALFPTTSPRIVAIEIITIAARKDLQSNFKNCINSIPNTSVIKILF